MLSLAEYRGKPQRLAQDTVGVQVDDGLQRRRALVSHDCDDRRIAPVKNCRNLFEGNVLDLNENRIHIRRQCRG